MPRAALLAALVGLGLTGTAGAERLKVIVSFQPLFDVVSRVAADAADVERAAPIGSSPHNFDPTVRDVARIRSAQLAVMAGLGADAWLERYVQSSGSRARMLKLGDQMNFVRLRSGQSTDPHWWLDASLMAQAARLIGQELAALDPAQADRYCAAAARESAALMALHRELQTTLKPVQGGKLVTFHNAFGYFARAYGY